MVYHGHERDGALSAFDLLSVPHGVVVVEAPRRIGNLTEIRVAPVSLALDMAMEDQGDVVVDREGSPCGLPFLIEVWNDQPMLAENLDTCLGSLRDETMEKVLDQRGRFSCLSYSELVSQALDTDPKWRFRAREYQQTAYLRAPAQAAREVFAPQTLRAWLEGLVARGVSVFHWAWVEFQAPARALAAAAPREGAWRQVLETADPRLQMVVHLDSADNLWLAVQTSDLALLGQYLKVWLAGHEVPAQAQIRELGRGRYGAVVLLGRLPQGCQQPPVLGVTVVSEAER